VDGFVSSYSEVRVRRLLGYGSLFTVGFLLLFFGVSYLNWSMLFLYVIFYVVTLLWCVPLLFNVRVVVYGVRYVGLLRVLVRSLNGSGWVRVFSGLSVSSLGKGKDTTSLCGFGVSLFSQLYGLCIRGSMYSLLLILYLTSFMGYPLLLGFLPKLTVLSLYLSDLFFGEWLLLFLCFLMCFVCVYYLRGITCMLRSLVFDVLFSGVGTLCSSWWYSFLCCSMFSIFMSLLCYLGVVYVG